MASKELAIGQYGKVRTMPGLWAGVRGHYLPCLGIFLIQLIAATVFLTSRASGTDSALSSVPLDDTWIHFVYARSFAEHLDFFYNEGVREAGMTSPLWVVVLGMAFKLFLPLGFGPVLISKVLGIAIGIATAILVYALVMTLTGRVLVSTAAGALVAIEPFITFDNVSGMDVSLFSFLVALSLLLLLRERRLALGICLGLIPLSRPEGYLLVAAILGVVVIRRLRQQEGSEIMTREDALYLAPTLLPVVLFSALLVGYNYSINGTPFPNTYLVKHRPELGLFNLTNLGATWSGYLRQLPYFTGFSFIPSFFLLVLGSIFILRKKGLLSLPLVLLPWLLLYALTTNIKLDPNFWNFHGRRYVDTAIIFIVVIIVVGLWYAFQHLRPFLEARVRGTAAQAWLPTYGFPLIMLGLIVGPFWSLPAKWPVLLDEYSWNTRNIQEVNEAMGRWVDQSLPRDAIVGIGDAGAIKYFGNRQAVDLAGLNTHQAIGRLPSVVAQEYRVDYVIIFRDPYFDNWPNAKEIYRLSPAPEHTTILGGGEMVVYKMDWVKKPNKNLLQ